MRKCVIPILLAFVSMTAFSQLYEVKGIVIDSLKNPIPFATIEILKKGSGTGTAAYENGAFKLSIPKTLMNDTLTIKALGFKTEKIPIQLINREESIYITLCSAIYELSETVIRPGSTTYEEFGNIETSKWTGGLLTKDLTQIAVYIENPKKEKGRLNEVSFFVSRGGKPKAPVRIRIYGYNTKEEPIGEDLLHETIILRPYNKYGWNSIELSAYNI
jgi:hypothetical protein